MSSCGSARSGSTCSSGGGSACSDIADFVLAFGSDSEDGELLPPSKEDAARAPPTTRTGSGPPFTEPEPERVREQHGAVGSPAAERGARLAAETHETVPSWEELCVSFRRSDPPGQVVEAFMRVPGWQLMEVQQALWHQVLAQRVANGAGSREYVTKVLKAVVDVCDIARQEVAELLLDKLIALRANAAIAEDIAVLAEAAGAEPTEVKRERCREHACAQRMPSKVPVRKEARGEPRPHVISLGTDCFSRTQAMRLGWVASRLKGYESGPFDIAYHSYSAVCSLIRDDFSGYMGMHSPARPLH
jgi:hypothetical protein